MNDECDPLECKSQKLDHTDKYYMHKAEYILENEIKEMCRDFKLQTEN